MLTNEASPLTTPPVLTDQDLDPQAAALYRQLKGLLDSLSITEQDSGVVVAGGARNFHTGHGQFPISASGATVAISLGITLPNANYAVILTTGNSSSQNRLGYESRTDTGFTVRLLNGGTGGETLDFSWLVAY